MVEGRNAVRAIGLAIYWCTSDLVISGRKLTAVATRIPFVVKHAIKESYRTFSLMTTRNYLTASHKIMLPTLI
jgi:hypothetical protein